MSSNAKSRRRLAFVALLSAVLLTALGVCAFMHWRSARFFATTFRIGFYNSPPKHFLGSNGKAAGSAVDLLNEAARRSGIKLDWVYSPEEGDAALETGAVDDAHVCSGLQTKRPDRSGQSFTQPNDR